MEKRMKEGMKFAKESKEVRNESGDACALSAR